jgi:catechol 2,3-dioxygenase-like lactoylglutathione lyase family enzyme
MNTIRKKTVVNMSEQNTYPRMHVSLYVSNIYQTADFYSKFFGQNPDKVKPDYTKFTLEKPSLIISFVQNPEKVNAGFGHLGFQVESEDELKNRLLSVSSKQIDVLEEMGTNCCYATQDKFWVTDPDGHMWEVYHFHKDVEFNDPRYASNDADVVACCTPEVATEAKPKVKLSEIQNNNCDPDSGCC